MRTMSTQNKTRLNLYLSRDIIDFGKKWSYVTNVSISRMVEQYLREQQKIVEEVTPFQWVSDQTYGSSLSQEDEELLELESFLKNREEKDFCEAHPEHPRAKMRKKLSKEYKIMQASRKKKVEKEEKNLIERWLKTFS